MFFFLISNLEEFAAHFVCVAIGCQFLVNRLTDHEGFG